LIEADSRPLGLDVDLVTCMLFWSTGRKNKNMQRGKINRISLIDGSSKTIHSGLGYPVQIAVNWITRKLYWSDTVLKTIEYSDLDGNNRKKLLTNVNKANAIALDHRVNVIYWISKGQDGFVISKMKLDETNKHEIILSNNLKSPNSLVIDFASCRLYWTDNKRIETSDLEGGDRYTLYTTNSTRPTGISLFNNILFWAEWKFKRIVRGTTDGSSWSTFVSNIIQTTAIHIVYKARQPRSCE